MTMYKRLAGICITAGALLLCVITGRALEPERCSVNMLMSYLEEEAPEAPYVYAEIMVKNDYRSPYAKGTAEISWKSFREAEAFEEYFSMKEGEDVPVSFEDTEYAMKFIYYRYSLEEDIHALDLYHALKEKYDEEENPFYASKIGNKKDGYYFNQFPDRVMAVKDGTLYGMERKGCVDAEFYADFSRKLIFNFVKEKLSANNLSGWGLDDEDLYWIDHETRQIRMENPDRAFLEVRAIDTCWWGQTIMENFGMLKEADYQISLGENMPAVQIHFSFAGKIPEIGYQEYLLNGFYMDEDYEMTVTNMETNEIYQKQMVSLSIELPDMISFRDLDGDGYLDMQIERPVHSSGERAVISSYKEPYFMLWNPKQEIFEMKYEYEIEERRQQNQRQVVYMNEYVVQPGDTLWGIAGKFYGYGDLYGKIEKENADILSGHKYLLPGMRLQIPW